jgi:hypothetical protein
MQRGEAGGGLARINSSVDVYLLVFKSAKSIIQDEKSAGWWLGGHILSGCARLQMAFAGMFAQTRGKCSRERFIEVVRTAASELEQSFHGAGDSVVD